MNQITISPSSGVPIYKQLFNQIERMVLNGYYAQGDSLPSVRKIAADLEVNPMTVSKAYGLLEERGYLTRLRGKGMIVTKQDNETTEQERIMSVNRMIETLITDASVMGIKSSQLLSLFQEKLATNATSESSKEN